MNSPSYLINGYRAQTPPMLIRPHRWTKQISTKGCQPDAVMLKIDAALRHSRSISRGKTRTVGIGLSFGPS